MRCAVLLAAAITCTAITEAFAQSEGKFAIGAQLTTRSPMGPEKQGHVGVNLLWRFGQSKTGWGWHYGLGWFGTDLTRTIGGTETDFGRLRVRPLLGGYGYTKVFGRTAVTGKLMGGVAFSSVRLTPEAINAYHTRIGGDAVTVKASPTFAVIPEIHVWYNINKKVGLRISSGYVIARPDVIVTSTAGVDKRRIRADNVTFRVGMVYSVFPFTK